MIEKVKGVFKFYNDNEILDVAIGGTYNGAKIKGFEYYGTKRGSCQIVDIIFENGEIRRIFNPDEIHFEKVEQEGLSFSARYCDERKHFHKEGRS